MSNSIGKRKQDHVQLALEQWRKQWRKQEGCGENPRGQQSPFFYEPMLSGHLPAKHFTRSFLGKTIASPLMISSMTGGWHEGARLNEKLAKLAAQFQMPMGLGSMACLLKDEKHLADFDVREYLGAGLPLLANIGIAQVEQMLSHHQLAEKFFHYYEKLGCDGLIIHVNPLQEWLQPEGDTLQHAPALTITSFVQRYQHISFIIKEVGQGFGPGSLDALLKMPITAIDLAGRGGTNFSAIEASRSGQQVSALVDLGHSCWEMLPWLVDLFENNSQRPSVDTLIFSGGIGSVLDAHYFLSLSPAKLTLVAMAGQILSWVEKSENYAQEQLQHWHHDLLGACAYLIPNDCLGKSLRGDES